MVVYAYWLDWRAAPRTQEMDAIYAEYADKFPFE